MMRNGQNNNKQRMRGRNNNHNSNNNNNNRKGQNPMTRVYESNGPDLKIRGTASHVAEKYMQLARDSQTSGDPVAAENYFQHAEHYLRMIAAAQEQFRQQNPSYREGESRDGAFDEGEGSGSEGGGFGQNQNDGQFQPREQSQPYQQREGQQPQHNREQQYNREPRPNREPRYDNRDASQGNRPQPVAPSAPASSDAGEDTIDRLPAFVTGGVTAPPAAVQNGANGQGAYEGGADRFPLHRRRRRRHGPRSEMGGPNEGEQGASPQPVEPAVE